MDLDVAAAFLVGSIAYSIGVLAWIGVLVAVNNLFHRYWKPVRIFTGDSWQFFPPPRFVEPTEVEHKDAKH